MEQIYLKIPVIKNNVFLIFIVMIKMSKIIREIEVGGLPSEKLLDWFLKRVNHTFVFFDTETTGLDRNPAGRPANQLTQIAAIATQINGETLRFFELGFGSRICLSGDLARRSSLTSWGGGPGYTHIPWRIIPWLRREGLQSEEITQLTKNNLLQLLRWQKNN
jgi:hypothetical protein